MKSNGLTLVLVGALACHHDRAVAPPEAFFSVAAVGGNLQHGPAGGLLPDPLVVQIRNAIGVPVKGARVVFHVQRGGASGSHLLDSIGVTSPEGIATAELQLGTALDTTVVVAYPAPAISQGATLKAVATATPLLTSVTPSTFGAGDTVTLRGTGLSVIGSGGAVDFGGVLASPLAGTTDVAVRALAPACLAPGPVSVRAVAGPARSNASPGVYLSRTAPVSLASYQTLVVRSDQLPDCLALAGLGAAYVVAAQYASASTDASPVDWRLGASGVASPVTEAVALRRAGDNPLQREFEGFLRRREAAVAPRVRAEALERGRDRASFQLSRAIAPTLGTLRTFKALAALDGSKYADVTARLRFAGDHLLLFVDTAGAGFTDEQYQDLGVLFDQQLYPIAVNAFGSESDIDGNGRILALFTPVVNQLIAAQDCGFKGYVTGYFNSDDLVLTSPNSNKAEIFFSFIPDSAGKYSCQHTAADVLRILQGTFIHELQHMISFNQHVITRLGTTEEVWLNEGLSHIAEELASKHFEKKFPPPTGRSTTEQLFPDSAGPFIAPQLLNAYVYLNSTRAHSVTSYVGVGSVEERGATWLFLRWLGEQKGEDLFRRLVQTSRTGVANIAEKTGEPFGTLFGDFSIALWADSLLGVPRAQVPARLRFGSRELRKLMAREATISGFQVPFPLPLFNLGLGGSLRSSMLPGTMTHALLQPPATQPAAALRFTRQDLSPFSLTLGAQVTIFRLP